MIRNLKAILLSAMAIMAMSAIASTASQAAEFHSEQSETTLTLTTDGTGKTSHQVFDAAGATVTCAGVSGHGLVTTPTATTVTLDVNYYGPCTFVGQSASVSMGSCDYTVTSHGTVSITDSTGGSCAANPITISVPSPPCTVTVSNAAGVNQNKHHIKFHNLGSGSSREVTIEPTVTGISYTATGSGCPTAGSASNGEYTTGNVIVTGEVKNGTTMVGVWWE